MRPEKVSHVTSYAHEAKRWSPQEDFTLMLMVGSHSYAAIALRLGRSASAVQRRASLKGYSARQEWSGDRETRTRLREARSEEILLTPEEDLTAYVVECDEEPPVTTVPGSRTYHREYKREQRRKAAS